LSSDAPSFVSRLTGVLTGKVCVVGVGNRLRGDDAAGPLLVDRLSGNVRVACIDAGVAPENYLEKIARCDSQTVLLIDALNFGGVPGEARIFAPDDLAFRGISSHAPSLGMACEYLKLRCGARVFLLGIQPETVALGEGPSRAVLESIDRLAAAIQEATE